MKLAMKLTLDGLKRALRRKAHELAEDIALGYRPPRAGAETGPKPRRAARARERNDDRPGR